MNLGLKAGLYAPYCTTAHQHLAVPLAPPTAPNLHINLQSPMPYSTVQRLVQEAAARQGLMGTLPQRGGSLLRHAALWPACINF